MFFRQHGTVSYATPFAQPGAMQGAKKVTLGKGVNGAVQAVAHIKFWPKIATFLCFYKFNLIISILNQSAQD